MRVPVRLPDLGASTVHFGLWVVEAGEQVYEGDRLAEVLLPGASVEISSPATGILVERHVYPRDTVSPGQILGYVEATEEA